MHIIIGIITAMAGLIWALYRLQDAGVDLNAFNPFTFFRRRQWEKKYGTKPMHNLTRSMDAAALLVVAVVLADGEISRETKEQILSLFVDEFGMNMKQAIDSYAASSHMLKDAMDMAAEVRHILAPSLTTFDATQRQSLLRMLDRASQLEHQPSEQQVAIIDAVRAQFDHHTETPTKW